jgi:hypothetical protein
MLNKKVENLCAAAKPHELKMLKSEKRILEDEMDDLECEDNAKKKITIQSIKEWFHLAGDWLAKYNKASLVFQNITGFHQQLKADCK